MARSDNEQNPSVALYRDFENLHAGLAATRCLALSAAVLLSACVYVPRTTLVYDHECKAMAKQLVLEGGQVAAIQRCENQGCIALIVGASVVTAATIVVSGSIVVVGNIVYWLERKARCQPAS